MNDDTRDWIVNLALKLQGIPYIWGGSTVNGFDCSGFIIWVLQVFEILPSGDWTAQGLSKTFEKTLDPKPGDLVFYGRERVTHVMMYMGAGMCVGASGGDSSTTSAEAANQKGAKVKVKSVTYRSDLVSYGSIGNRANGNSNANT